MPIILRQPILRCLFVSYGVTNQVGMHGSFVVCAHAVEVAVGFDHGLAASITEDACDL